MKEWKTYLVEDLFEEIAMGPFGSNIKVDCFQPTGVPVLNGSNLFGYTLNEDSFNYVSTEKADSLGRSNAFRGDIVITHRGTLGQIVYIPENSKYDRYVISQSQFRLKLDTTKVLPSFFVYFFHTRLGQHRLLSNASQVGVPAIARPTSTFKKVEIELPSISLQQRIVDILDSIGNKIELNNRINHNLEEQARNIFLSYIDCDCVECPFSDLITVGSGGTPRTSESRFWNGDIPFFSPKDVSNSCFTLFTEKLITKDGLNNCNSSLYHENTTFITARGTVGKISLAGVSMAMNQSCFALTSKDNTPYFAYFLTERVVESLKKKANGAVFDAINSKDILQELVRVPNRDVIFQIEDRIRPYMNSIRFKSIENLYLTDTRDTLLPKLLSGELKINDLTC